MSDAGFEELSPNAGKSGLRGVVKSNVPQGFVGSLDPYITHMRHEDQLDLLHPDVQRYIPRRAHPKR